MKVDEEKMSFQNFMKKYRYLIAAFWLGFIAFLFVFSLEPLRITGIGWTLYGYDNEDIIQHQTGWMYYRNSPWSFPICKALYLGYPEGTSIAFTDSIPLVAVFFKLLSPILPEKFQYFGIYTCFCFMMQGLFGAALLFHFTHNHVFSCVGSLIFVFSSCFLERCFRHTALSSHWLLLAGLLLYFTRIKYPEKKPYHLLWAVLLCITIGIHPYLFAMNFGLFFISEWSMLNICHSKKKEFFSFLLITGISYLVSAQQKAG